MNKLITFEGIEGSGKSTQMRLVSLTLIEQHVPLLITQEPSGTDIGRKIGGILFNRGHYYMCAETEAFLFCAARAQHVREMIMPALNQDKVVLCDRFSDATYAYQGAARGLNRDFIKIINSYSSMGLKPDLTLLFDLPVEEGLKRATERDNQLKDSSFSDRFERESLVFHNKVREGYLQIRKNEPERFRLIDATRDIDTIRNEVYRHIAEFIGLKT
ncbi:MAG: Thymidylate kinase [Smithella sp. PtaU1.Bin162]|nr:MAG: Thymidylate kinase [Smithella sp. PtaU1.Bin162]